PPTLGNDQHQLTQWGSLFTRRNWVTIHASPTAIRALVRGASGRGWTVAERMLHGLLVDEWMAAERAELVQAA
ncbi:hypothetical protein, partial [Streptomyces sp. NPDC057257]|uniref:hypothetical protein n=1 Tax=Streptomyces sp. NPDC057257 TaxID=3346071 RepID=UPI0036269E88